MGLIIMGTTQSILLNKSFENSIRLASYLKLGTEVYTTMSIIGGV